MAGTARISARVYVCRGGVEGAGAADCTVTLTVGNAQCPECATKSRKALSASVSCEGRRMSRYVAHTVCSTTVTPSNLDPRPNPVQVRIHTSKAGDCVNRHVHARFVYGMNFRDRRAYLLQQSPARPKPESVAGVPMAHCTVVQQALAGDSRRSIAGHARYTCVDETAMGRWCDTCRFERLPRGHPQRHHGHGLQSLDPLAWLSRLRACHQIPDHPNHNRCFQKAIMRR